MSEQDYLVSKAARSLGEALKYTLAEGRRANHSLKMIAGPQHREIRRAAQAAHGGRVGSMKAAFRAGQSGTTEDFSRQSLEAGLKVLPPQKADLYRARVNVMNRRLREVGGL